MEVLLYIQISSYLTIRVVVEGRGLCISELWCVPGYANGGCGVGLAIVM